jgi:hypothetical protein
LSWFDVGPVGGNCIVKFRRRRARTLTTLQHVVAVLARKNARRLIQPR